MTRPELLRVSMLILIGFGSLLAMVFWPAGTWQWPEGWIFVALIFLTWLVTTLLLARFQPELVGRRTRIGKGTKRWDLYLMGALKLIFVGLVVVPSFGVRFGWPRLHASWVYVGIGLYAAGYAFLLWAMLVNPHFESTVRIQTDRGHRVIDTGPYGYVRHPGYVGFLVLTLGIPLVLRSLWALPGAAVVVMWVFLRAALEDRTLRSELDGYAAYAARVRFRIIPGVW